MFNDGINNFQIIKYQINNSRIIYTEIKPFMY